MSKEISKSVIDQKMYYYEKRCKIWEGMKKYINELKINDTFSCNSLTAAAFHSISEKKTNSEDVTRFVSSVELYRYYLGKAGLIKYLGESQYRKITNIPKNTEIIHLKTIMLEIRENPWKEWFVPLHERLGVAEEELYGGVGEMETQRVVAPL